MVKCVVLARNPPFKDLAVHVGVDLCYADDISASVDDVLLDTTNEPASQPVNVCLYS